MLVEMLPSEWRLCTHSVCGRVLNPMTGGNSIFVKRNIVINYCTIATDVSCIYYKISRYRSHLGGGVGAESVETCKRVDLYIEFLEQHARKSQNLI